MANVTATAAASDVESAITQERLATPTAAAPRADHAVTAGGQKFSETLGGGGNAPGDVHGTDAGGAARNTHASDGGQAEWKKGAQGQLKGRPPPPRLDKEEEEGGRAKCTGRDERAKEQHEEAFPTWNGGECRDGLYAWNQSIREARGRGQGGQGGQGSGSVVCCHMFRAWVAVPIFRW